MNFWCFTECWKSMGCNSVIQILTNLFMFSQHSCVEICKTYVNLQLSQQASLTIEQISRSLLRKVPVCYLKVRRSLQSTCEGHNPRLSVKGWANPTPASINCQRQSHFSSSWRKKEKFFQPIFSPLHLVCGSSVSTSIFSGSIFIFLVFPHSHTHIEEQPTRSSNGANLHPSSSPGISTIYRRKAIKREKGIASSCLQ